MNYVTWAVIVIAVVLGGIFAYSEREAILESVFSEEIVQDHGDTLEMIKYYEENPPEEIVPKSLQRLRESSEEDSDKIRIEGTSGSGLITTESGIEPVEPASEAE